MSVLDDISKAAQAGILAGLTAARAQGQALGEDAAALIAPDVQAILAELAQIALDTADGTIDQAQATDSVAAQIARLQTLTFAAAELSAVSLQIVLNAILSALRGAVNAAAALPIFP